jgi:hypothetical protein
VAWRRAAAAPLAGGNDDRDLIAFFVCIKGLNCVLYFYLGTWLLFDSI